jgi:hypothetical protein
MRKKSNRLLGVAWLAIELGREHMSDYVVVTSRKDFTQRQLMACLACRLLRRKRLLFFSEADSVARVPSLSLLMRLIL